MLSLTTDAGVIKRHKYLTHGQPVKCQGTVLYSRGKRKKLIFLKDLHYIHNKHCQYEEAIFPRFYNENSWDILKIFSFHALLYNVKEKLTILVLTKRLGRKSTLFGVGRLEISGKIESVKKIIISEMTTASTH